MIGLNNIKKAIIASALAFGGCNMQGESFMDKVMSMEEPLPIDCISLDYSDKSLHKPYDLKLQLAISNSNYGDDPQNNTKSSIVGGTQMNNEALTIGNPTPLTYTKSAPPTLESLLNCIYRYFYEKKYLSTQDPDRRTIKLLEKYKPYWERATDQAKEYLLILIGEFGPIKVWKTLQGLNNTYNYINNKENQDLIKALLIYRYNCENKLSSEEFMNLWYTLNPHVLGSNYKPIDMVMLILIRYYINNNEKNDEEILTKKAITTMGKINPVWSKTLDSDKYYTLKILKRLNLGLIIRVLSDTNEGVGQIRKYYGDESST